MVAKTRHLKIDWICAVPNVIVYSTLFNLSNIGEFFFFLVSGGHICAPQKDTNMASPYKAL